MQNLKYLNMETTKKILNYMVKNSIIFLLTLLITNFYINSRIISYIFAILLTITISLVIVKISKTTTEKNNVKTNNKRQFQDFQNYVKTSTASQQEKMIKYLTNNKIENKISFYKFKDNIALFNLLTATLSKENVLICCNIAKQNKLKKIVILSFNSPSLVINFSKTIKNFKIEILTCDNIFKKLKEKKYTFDKPIETAKSFKITIKQFFELLFHKKNAKTFFILGIVTFLLSFFTFLKLYYYIFTSIFIVFAVVCTFKKQQQTNQNML